MERDRVFSFFDILIKFCIFLNAGLLIFNTYQANRTYEFNGVVVDSYMKPFSKNGKTTTDYYLVVYNDSLKSEAHAQVDNITYSAVYSNYKYRKVKYTVFLTKAEMFERPDYFFLITEKQIFSKKSVLDDNNFFVLFYILLLVILNILRDDRK